jgi:hypothetical protein
MKLNLYMVSLAATGLIAIPPASIAHGISAHHMSAVETHDNDRDHDRYRYSGIYFGPPFGAYGVSYYDADYCYTPTAEQIVTAQEQVQDYLLAVKKHRKRAATHRYISVETRRPKKKSSRITPRNGRRANLRPSQEGLNLHRGQWILQNCVV